MPGGRPTDLTPAAQAAAIKYAGLGAPRDLIAQAIGVAPSTFYKWLKWGRDDYDPETDAEAPADLTLYREFREAFDQAQATPILMLQTVAMQAAQDGDARVAMRMMRLLRPDLYREAVEFDASETLRSAVAEWAQAIGAMGDADESSE